MHGARSSILSFRVIVQLSATGNLREEKMRQIFKRQFATRDTIGDARSYRRSYLYFHVTKKIIHKVFYTKKLLRTSNFLHSSSFLVSFS